MSRTGDKMIELEEAGVIVYNNAINTYVLVDQNPEPVPFDLAAYLFQLYREEANKS